MDFSAIWWAINHSYPYLSILSFITATNLPAVYCTPSCHMSSKPSIRYNEITSQLQSCTGSWAPLGQMGLWYWELFTSQLQLHIDFHVCAIMTALWAQKCNHKDSKHQDIIYNALEIWKSANMIVSIVTDNLYYSFYLISQFFCPDLLLNISISIYHKDMLCLCFT